MNNTAGSCGALPPCDRSERSIFLTTLTPTIAPAAQDRYIHEKAQKYCNASGGRQTPDTTTYRTDTTRPSSSEFQYSFFYFLPPPKPPSNPGRFFFLVCTPLFFLPPLRASFSSRRLRMFSSRLR